MVNPLPHTLGRYKIVGLIATGGMAEIFLASQPGIRKFEKLVVLKRILPHLARDEYFVDMFLDEARIAARLNHPNIVQIYDVGQQEDDYYIAMEYVEGESLEIMERCCAQLGLQLTPSLAAGIAAQLCDGLSYAHRLCDPGGEPLGIVHRDVSPQNILVQLTGGVKLVDFGIAKAAARDHQTQTGTLKGKLTYMSPEQLLGGHVDARSDMFSLGVVLWEMLTRKRLFQRKSEGEIIQAIQYEPIPKVRRVAPDIPPEFARIVDKALKKRPESRFQTALDLAEAIREIPAESMKRATIPEIAAFASHVLAPLTAQKQKVIEEFRAAKSDFFEPVIIPRPQKPSPSSELKTVVPDDENEISDIQKRKLAQTKHSTQTGPNPTNTPRIVLFLLIPTIVASLIILFFREPDNPLVRELTGSKQQVTIVPADTKPPSKKTGSDFDNEGIDLSLDCKDQGLCSDEKGNKNKDIALRPDPARLTVRSTPTRCAVRIDKKLIDDLTPIQDLPIEPNTIHIVRVLCTGHRKGTQKALGRPGESVTLVYKPPAEPGKIEPGKSNKTDGGQALKKDGGPSKDPDVPAEKPGSLVSIRSIPARCPVLLDGKSIGDRTPVEQLPIEAGKTHLIQVQCDGYQPKSRKVSGKAGQHLKLYFRLTLAP